MPYPDAKYPPAKAESDRMRLALTAIRNDCFGYMSADAPSIHVKLHLLPGVWDCARTALGEGNQ